MSDITTTKQQVIKKNNLEFLPNFVKVKDTKSKKRKNEFKKPRNHENLDFSPTFFSLIALQTNQGHKIT